ncbi:S-protein homolog 5-like [Trifolium pratense]|uniref:S-protein homolog 5-like n=1 Tax=Trifolium pratense TaxID=57577 RepID=UPI001E691E6E|nr:S-protein homolog 5-like [Trifolium pratense]XP_045810186.1 S-protein homolog 5-like [Trifolium pratense]
MMISVSKILSLVPILLIIFVALQFADGKAEYVAIDGFPPIFPPRVHVFINNNISNTALGVHCKDKNNDAGFRSINFGGTYTFDFKPNKFVQSSLWFCRFSWGNEFQYFDIYVQKRDVNLCVKECHWAIIKSGACRIIDGSSECFPWNPKVVTEH